MMSPECAHIQNAIKCSSYSLAHDDESIAPRISPSCRGNAVNTEYLKGDGTKAVPIGCPKTLAVKALTTHWTCNHHLHRICRIQSNGQRSKTVHLLQIPEVACATKFNCVILTINFLFLLTVIYRVKNAYEPSVVYSWTKPLFCFTVV